MQKSNSVSRPVQKVFGVTLASLSLLGVTVAPAVLGTALVQAAPKDTVELRTYIGKTVYRPGDKIPVGLRATNTSRKDITLQFTSGQRYDFKIYRQNDPNNPVYTWSANKLFIAQTGTVEIERGKVQPYNDTLDTSNLPAGKYRLEGILTSNPQIKAPGVSFEILGLGGNGNWNNGGNNNGNSVKAKLDLMATTNKTNYAPGETVTVSFTLKNVGSNTANVYFKAGELYDVVVRNSDNDAVWKWSDDKTPLLKSPPLTLQPGESKTYTVNWDQSNKNDKLVKSGKYSVTTFIETENRIKSNSVDIRIK